MARTALPVEERFWAKVTKTKTCWLWTGQIFPSGHGGFYWGPRQRMFASRASWIIHYGEILPGFSVCHQCTTPSCVRPSHLALGTNSDNHRDGNIRPHGMAHILDYKKPVIDDATRFWSKVQKAESPDGCWLWTGAISHTNGYGAAWQNRHQISAHRLGYLLLYGPIPEGLFVLHTCDIKLCVRHLYLGTPADNFRDMIARGQQRIGIHGQDPVPDSSRARGLRNGKYTKPERTPRGEAHGSKTHPERTARGKAHPLAKFSEADVREMRRMAQQEGMKAGEIARLLSLSYYTVWDIIRGRSWKHLLP